MKVLITLFLMLQYQYGNCGVSANSNPDEEDPCNLPVPIDPIGECDSDFINSSGSSNKMYSTNQTDQFDTINWENIFDYMRKISRSYE